MRADGSIDVPGTFVEVTVEQHRWAARADAAGFARCRVAHRPPLPLSPPTSMRMVDAPKVRAGTTVQFEKNVASVSGCLTPLVSFASIALRRRQRLEVVVQARRRAR
ncbi:hypothetical protein WG70_04115 [Burkholderia oklahomensis EO147]|nr:hypothetical protein WG70_04115 [Burkholderia oklahomensis EO147]